MLKTRPILAATAAVFLLFSAGCKPQTRHPNQINAFDGASYDSLTAARAALVSLRVPIATDYPQYIATFNQAAATYDAAYQAYVLFRAAPTQQTPTALALSNLTVSIIFLENTFQADMHVSPKTILTVRGAAVQQRAVLSSRITISDVLSELAIAASIAAGVPGAQPYAVIAELVIKATQEAVTAIHASNGKPMEFSLIQPVPAIS